MQIASSVDPQLRACGKILAKRRGPVAITPPTKPVRVIANVVNGHFDEQRMTVILETDLIDETDGQRFVLEIHVRAWRAWVRAHEAGRSTQFKEPRANSGNAVAVRFRFRNTMH